MRRCTHNLPDMRAWRSSSTAVMVSASTPRRPTIGSDPLPRLPQNATFVDAVAQGVETPTLWLSGRSP